MKLTKAIVSALLLCAMMVPATDLAAQTRKRSKTASRTATTKKSTAKKSTARTLPLSKEALKDTRYIGMYDLNGGLGVFSIVDFSQYSVKINYGSYDKMSANSYEVEGNQINGERSMSSKWAINFTSDNGGKTLKGSLKNVDTRNTQTGTFIKVPLHPTPATQSAEELLNILSSTQYTAYLTVTKAGQPELAFPVTITFKKGEENTWKIGYDNEMLMQVGGLKGTFTLNGNKISSIDSDGGSGSGELYDNGTYGYIRLGQRKAPGLVADFGITFVKK